MKILMTNITIDGKAIVYDVQKWVCYLQVTKFENEGRISNWAFTILKIGINEQIKIIVVETHEEIWVNGLVYEGEFIHFGMNPVYEISTPKSPD